MVRYIAREFVKTSYPNMAEQYIEVVVSIMIPLAAYLINWRVRVGWKLDYTSGAADLLLSVWAFDLVVLTAENLFSKAVKANIIRENFDKVTVLLFLLAIVVWIWPTLMFEEKITHPKVGPTGLLDLTRPIFCWMAAAAVLSSHIAVYRIESFT